MAKYMVLNRGSKRVKVFRKMKLPFMEVKTSDEAGSGVGM